MYVYMYCIFDQIHEDMLFHEGGVCDTLGIQGFLRFSGELVSFVELGQPDLIKVL